MINTLDRVLPVLSALCAASLLAAFAMIFFYAPIESTMGIVQKIFYVHVPAAMAAYAGFTICSVASLAYLIRPSRGWDITARSGAEVGMLFCVFVLISGPLWGAKAWGKPWVWDPQLTATFVLFLLYGGYVLLRALSSENKSMRNIAAVLAVFAFVDIPVIHYAVRKWGGLHPVIEREGGGGLVEAMKTTFSVSMLAFLLLFILMLTLLIKARLTAAQVESLHLELESAALMRGEP